MSEINSSVKDGVLTLSMQRPEKKNALNLQMYQQLTAALNQAQQDTEIKVVLLQGSAECFTSGNDLKDFLSAGELNAAHPVVQFLYAVSAFPKPLVAAVAPNAPFKTVKELVAYAKANPGKVSFASSGTGSAAHLTSELLKSLTKTFMVHIPYRGAAPALTDLLGGQVPLFLDPPPNLIQPAKAGRITLIGVASEKRLPMLPDVPTFIEQGVPGMLGSTWASMIAPAGTSRDVVKRMSDAVNAIIQSEETKAKLETMGTFGEGTTPEACDAFLAAETTKWGKVIRDAGVTLD